MKIEDIINKSKEIESWLIKIRRDLHETPELAMEEYITKSKIKSYLDEIGISYDEYSDHRGIMAYIIRDSKAYKTIGIRADMDALPICENNDKPYKSKHEGIMHACGHDAHCAILLGACKILYDMKEELRVNIKFFFQGAEEKFGGAKYFIKDKCMENPNVNYMFGLHVQPYIETGCIECKSKILNASSNSIKIIIKGKRAHGAYPENGIDALVCAAQIITSLQSIVSRNLSPQNKAVLTLGKIKGGEAQNVICENVEIRGTIRALSNEGKEIVINRAKEIIENTAKAYRCEGKLFIEGNGYPSVINDEELVEVVKLNSINFLGTDKYKEKEYPSMGAEDFSFYTEKCRGVFFHLGCGNKERNITSLIHTDKFDIDERCILIGTIMHVLNVLYFNGKS